MMGPFKIPATRGKACTTKDGADYQGRRHAGDILTICNDPVMLSRVLRTQSLQ